MTATVLYGSEYPFVLTSGFITCITYTWSIDNANVKIMFYGLIPVWGKYFPLIQLFISFVFNEGNFVISLIGFCHRIPLHMSRHTYTGATMGDDIQKS